MSTAERERRERLQQLSVAQWERERQGRADAYAAVLTHLNAAAAAVPYDNGIGTRLGAEFVHLAGNARGSLRRVLDEPNPFVAIRGERT
jgi:6-phosphofructokinase